MGASAARRHPLPAESLTATPACYIAQPVRMMSQHPLNYQGRTTHRQPWSEWRKAAVGMGVGVGAVITLPALFLATTSAGAGHGDYGFALGLFPIPMSIVVYGQITDSINLDSLVLACIQFPLYGATIGYCATKGRKALLIAASIIVLGHLVAFVACSGSSAFS